MKYTALRILVWVFTGILFQDKLCAQVIANGDGSPLETKYCRTDTNFALQLQPSGGQLTGCGVFQQNGQWYFNPAIATQGITVFPTQCNLVYTLPGGASTTVAMLVWKPVIITPPLQDTFTCNGSFELHAKTLYAGAYWFTWSPAAMLDQPDSARTGGYISGTQTFILTATDVISGCTGRDTVTVHRYPTPQVDAGPDTTINARGKVQLWASGATNYQWLPDRWLDDNTSPAPVSSPQAAITYLVTGSNEYGCTDTARVVIGIRETLFVPNAFSPNGDGLNDIFSIGNFGYQKVNAFQIFNRWGQRVFSTIDGQRGWDGTFQGMPAAPGSYFYNISVVLSDGTIQQMKGEVTLVR